MQSIEALRRGLTFKRKKSRKRHHNQEQRDTTPGGSGRNKLHKNYDSHKERKPSSLAALGMDQAIEENESLREEKSHGTHRRSHLMSDQFNQIESDRKLLEDGEKKDSGQTGSGGGYKKKQSILRK